MKFENFMELVIGSLTVWVLVLLVTVFTISAYNFMTEVLF